MNLNHILIFKSPQNFMYQNKVASSNVEFYFLSRFFMDFSSHVKKFHDMIDHFSNDELCALMGELEAAKERIEYLEQDFLKKM